MKKNRISASILFFVFMASINQAQSGGDSDHGGNPFRLNLIKLSEAQFQKIPDTVSFQDPSVLSRNCLIIKTLDKNQEPYGTYILDYSEVNGPTLFSEAAFALDAKDFQKITTNSESDDNLYKINQRDLSQNEAEDVASIKEALLTELEHPGYDSRFAQPLRAEVENLRIRVLKEDCFYLENNRYLGDYQPLSSNQVIGVHAFTQNKTGAPIYISESKLQTLTKDDLAQVFVGEAIHHLPLGPFAGDEDLVHSIAEAIIFGRNSINAQAVWFDLGPKLLMAQLLGSKERSWETLKSPITTEKESSSVEAQKIVGPVPASISQLILFLESPLIQGQAHSILDDFNDLFGRVKLTNMRQCSMSYWIYSGVALDRQNGKFDEKGPNEAEATLMVLRGYDHLFCSLWNSIYGSTYIGAIGYGTSSFFRAQRSCGWKPSKPFSINKSSLSAIPNSKQQRLKNLHTKIVEFRENLCMGLKTFYTNGTPFKGTPEERELLYAVINNDNSKTNELLKQGVNPNVGDMRERYSQSPEENWSVSYTTSYPRTSLLEISYKNKNYPLFVSLVDNGAQLNGPLLKMIFADIQKAEESKNIHANANQYLQVITQNKMAFSFDIAEILNAEDVCNEKIIKFVLENPTHNIKYNSKIEYLHSTVADIIESLSGYGQSVCTAGLKEYILKKLTTR